MVNGAADSVGLLFGNDGPQAAMQSKENTMVAWAPGIRDPEPPRHATPRRWSPSRTRRRQKDKEIASSPSRWLSRSPNSPRPSLPSQQAAANQGTNSSTELPICSDSSAPLPRSRAPLPRSRGFIGPRFRVLCPWVSCRRRGGGRSGRSAAAARLGCGRKDSPWLDF
jgi:hypothetical protein